VGYAPRHCCAEGQSQCFTGTGIPSQLAELTRLSSSDLDTSHLTGTIPSQLAVVELTGLTVLYLGASYLTGAVPSLTFKQWNTSNCCLNYGLPHRHPTNNFTCPLPAGAADCKCHGKPGVVCNKKELQ
jgi:hypothetical protein